MNPRQSTSLLKFHLVLALVAGAWSPAIAGLLAISSDGTTTSKLWDVNPANGVPTNPRTVSTAPDRSALCIAFAPSGILYGVSMSNPGSFPAGGKLFTIDPATGSAAYVATLTMFVQVEGDIAVDPTSGTLYAVDGVGHIFTINTTSGVCQSIGNLPSADYSAMTFNSSGELFVWNSFGPTLLKVNKANAAVISSVNLSPSPGGEIGGMAFHPATGTLYLGANTNTNARLSTVNTITGAVNPVGPLTGLDGVWAMAFTPRQVGVNKDFQNNTGTTANEIEWLIEGIYPAVTLHYDGPYPGQANTTFSSFQIIPAGPNTRLRWSGTASIPPGGFAHVGFTVAGDSLRTLGATWKFNGSVVGCAHQISIGTGHSHFLAGAVAFENSALECESSTLHVGKMRVEWFANEVPLANLNGLGGRSPMRADSIGGSPVAVPPNGETVVSIPLPPLGARYVMLRYTVSANPSLAGPGNTIDYAQYDLVEEEYVPPPVAAPILGGPAVAVFALLMTGLAVHRLSRRRSSPAA